MQNSLAQQMHFLLEADRLKQVERSTYISDGTRAENSAEHSWHLCLMAMVLQSYSPQLVQLGRVLELLTAHDLVEVYAGDTQIFDLEGQKTQVAREEQAARKLFGILPEAQEGYFHDLVAEFEQGATPEARFAKAIDQLHPAWLHWGAHSKNSPDIIPASSYLERKKAALEGFPVLWEFLQEIISSATQRGLIAEG